MNALEYGPLIVIALALLFVMIGMIPDRPEDSLTTFRQQCRAQGLDFRETEAAISIRLAFVRLRSMASDCCIAKGGDISRSEINEIAGSLAIGIAASHGLDASKSFIGWIDTCPDEEILYDDARSMRHRKIAEELRKAGYYPSPKDLDMEADFKDAFRIVRN